jgi:hypothetical protein
MTKKECYFLYRISQQYTKELLHFVLQLADRLVLGFVVSFLVFSYLLGIPLMVIWMSAIVLVRSSNLIPSMCTIAYSTYTCTCCYARYLGLLANAAVSHCVLVFIYVVQNSIYEIIY